VEIPATVDQLNIYAIQSGNGFHFLTRDDIISLEAQGNYTRITTTRTNYTCSRSLKNIMELLDDEQLVRVHNSCAINVQHAVEFIDSEDSMVMMDNGKKLPVSRRRRRELLNKYLQL